MLENDRAERKATEVERIAQKEKRWSRFLPS
jgi:hypothetical protein